MKENHDNHILRLILCFDSVFYNFPEGKFILQISDFLFYTFFSNEKFNIGDSTKPVLK